MSDSRMKYIYTKYGEEYAGALWDEMHLENYKVLIQFSKISDYSKVHDSDKSIEKISEYGWVIPNNAVYKIYSGSEFKPKRTVYQSESWNGNYDRSVMFVFGAGA